MVRGLVGVEGCNFLALSVFCLCDGCFVVGKGITMKPSFVEVSPYENDQFGQPALTISMFCVLACTGDFMQVNPFGRESTV